MKIGKHTLSLAAALVIGGALLSLSTGEAEARPRRPQDNGVRCAKLEVGNYWDFYMPGERYFDPVTGVMDQCGKDGKWIEVPDGDTGAPKGKGKGR